MGNGYFGTRGALEETEANETNYPGTYIAGVYNRLQSEVAGRTVVNEDFVNCPNWLPITFKIEDGEWLNPNNVEMVSFTRRLDFDNGVLHRRMVVKDATGRETLIESDRLANMAQPYLAALRYSITPLNYSDRISIRSGLDHRVINAGVERYRQLSSKHLEPITDGGEGACSHVLVQTNQSKLQIAEAAKLLISVNDERVDPDVTMDQTPGAVFSIFDLEAEADSSICVEKVVAIYASKDVRDPLKAAQEALHNIHGFDEMQHIPKGMTCPPTPRKRTFWL